MKHQLTEYIETERKRGVTEDAIRRELIEKGWDSIVIHRAMSGEAFSPDAAPKGSVTKPVEDDHTKSVNRLAGLGVALISIAFLLFVMGSWQSLSSLERFLTILVPNIALFGLVMASRRMKQLDYVADSLEIVGVLMLPFTLGAALVQFHLLTTLFGTNEISAIVLAALSGITALVAYLLASARRGILQALAVIMMAGTSLLSIAAATTPNQLWAALGVTFLFGLLLFVDYFDTAKREMVEYRNVVAIGVGLQAIIAGSLLASILAGRLEAFAFWSQLVTALVPVAVVSLLAVSVMYLGKKGKCKELRDALAIAVPASLMTSLHLGNTLSTWSYVLILLIAIVLLLISPLRKEFLKLPTLLASIVFARSILALTQFLVDINLILIIFAFGILLVSFALYRANKVSTTVRRQIVLPSLFSALVPTADYSGSELAALRVSHLQPMLQVVSVLSLCALVAFYSLYASYSTAVRTVSTYTSITTD